MKFCEHKKLLAPHFWMEACINCSSVTVFRGVFLPVVSTMDLLIIEIQLWANMVYSTQTLCVYF